MHSDIHREIMGELDDGLPFHGCDGLHCVAFTGPPDCPEYIRAHRGLPPDFPSHFVAELMDIGTCFVLGVIPSNITVTVEHKRLRAVLVTAGHCGFDFDQIGQFDLTLRCSFHHDNSLTQLKLIRNFIDMFGKASQDPKSGSNYCVGGDLALYACFDSNTTFTEVPYTNHFSEGDELLAVGRTKKLNVSFSLPHSILSDAEKRKKLKRLIPSNSWIGSNGPVKNTPTGYFMGAGRYTAANGCSGGPVLKVRSDPYAPGYQPPATGSYEIIGLHVGCAAVPMQHELWQLRLAVSVQDQARITQLCGVLNTYYTTLPPGRHTDTWRDIAAQIAAGWNEDAIDEITILLYMQVSSPSVISSQKINYNLFIPVTHPNFQQAIKITEELKSVTRDFASMKKLRKWALKF